MTPIKVTLMIAWATPMKKSTPFVLSSLVLALSLSQVSQAASLNDYGTAISNANNSYSNDDATALDMATQATNLTSANFEQQSTASKQRLNQRVYQPMRLSPPQVTTRRFLITLVCLALSYFAVHLPIPQAVTLTVAISSMPVIIFNCVCGVHTNLPRP